MDYIEGVISRNPSIEYAKNRKTLQKGTDYLCDVRGHWTEDLYIDGMLYWHIDDFKGFRVRPVKNALKSDCRYREDLIELLKGDEDTA